MNHSKEELLGFWCLQRLAWLVSHLSGLFTPREKCFLQTNYATDTSHANDFINAKSDAREKPLLTG